MDRELIIATDGDLWVLDKPTGLAVHPGAKGQPHLMQLAAEAGAPADLSPIHRLDKETSGLVLCSADAEVRAAVGQWFASGEVVKTYQALALGHSHKKGVIRRALSDGRRGRPLPAVTRYWRRQAFFKPTPNKQGPGRPLVSLLAVRPETGRRHQIRRHLQGIGHPVVGDERYPPRRFVAVPGFPNRLWLHCARLRLPDGRVFEAPLPEELAEQLEILGALGMRSALV